MKKLILGLFLLVFVQFLSGQVSFSERFEFPKTRSNIRDLSYDSTSNKYYAVITQSWLCWITQFDDKGLNHGLSEKINSRTRTSEGESFVRHGIEVTSKYVWFFYSIWSKKSKECVLYADIYNKDLTIYRKRVLIDNYEYVLRSVINSSGESRERKVYPDYFFKGSIKGGYIIKHEYLKEGYLIKRINIDIRTLKVLNIQNVSRDIQVKINDEDKLIIPIDTLLFNQDKFKIIKVRNGDTTRNIISFLYDKNKYSDFHFKIVGLTLSKDKKRLVGYQFYKKKNSIGAKGVVTYSIELDNPQDTKLFFNEFSNSDYEIYNLGKYEFEPINYTREGSEKVSVNGVLGLSFSGNLIRFKENVFLLITQILKSNNRTNYGDFYVVKISNKGESTIKKVLNRSVESALYLGWYSKEIITLPNKNGSISLLYDNQEGYFGESVLEKKKAPNLGKYKQTMLSFDSDLNYTAKMYDSKYRFVSSSNFTFDNVFETKEAYKIFARCDDEYHYCFITIPK